MNVANASLAAPLAAAAPPTAGSSQRTADGDFKAANVQSVQTMDSDGDYKPVTASAAGQSSPAVQSALTSLKVGG